MEPLSNRLIFLLQTLDSPEQLTAKLAPVFRSARGALLPVFDPEKLLSEAFVFTKNFLRELRSPVEQGQEFLPFREKIAPIAAHTDPFRLAVRAFFLPVPDSIAVAMSVRGST